MTESVSDRVYPCLADSKAVKISSKKLRLSLEGCKVCQDADCNGDSLKIIENACFDSLQLGCPTILKHLPFLLLLFTGSNHFLNSLPE